MFNNTSYSNNVVSNHVNAVTGSISKTYKESFFKRFNLKSRMAETLLSEQPSLYINGRTTPVVIVQMVVVGDMEVMAEIIFKSDYDNLF